MYDNPWIGYVAVSILVGLILLGLIELGLR